LINDIEVSIEALFLVLPLILLFRIVSEINGGNKATVIAFAVRTAK